MWKLAAIVGIVAALSACGGTAAPCAGVEAGGACWSGGQGVTVTAERASRILEIARRHYGVEVDPEGWTIQFASTPVTHEDLEMGGTVATYHVDGSAYHGFACARHRLIVVLPFGGADCIERSAIFHELGHAWGAAEGDALLYGEYDLMREAMEGAAWDGCTGARDD
jgi:hypothetical protein